MENRAAVRAYLKKYFQTRSIGSGKKGKGMTMKNRQKKVLALLLAGAMMALPVSQAFAETSYDASAGVEQQVLFPKDGLTGITAGLTVDGTQADASEDGSWTNTDDGKVYVADTAEDGSIQITQVGYELEVESGTASLKDGDDTYHHYRFGDWEQPDGSLDRAYYQEGDTVSIKADDPEDGMEFAGWKCDTDGVTIADPSSAETTFQMVGRKVKITATYKEAAQESTAHTLTVNYGDGSGSYEEGSWVTVTAADRSQEGYEFAGWSVDSANVSLADASAEETAFTMPNVDVTLTATYTEAVQTELSTEPATEPSTDPIVIGDETEAPATEPVTEPQTEAPATEPQTDTPETQPSTNQDNPIVIDPETEVPATEPQTEAPETEPQTETPVTEEPPETETEQKYEVTVNNGIGSGEYAAGEMVSVEAPYEGEDGEVFSQWQTSSDVQLEDAQQAVTTFVMPENPVELTAEYAAPKYQVSVENGSADVDELEAGKTVTVTADDRFEEGLKFSHWEGSAVVDGEDTALIFADEKAETTTFTMPSGDAEVKAVYEEAKESYKVTVANGLINGTSTEMFCEENEKITVTANPSESGQQFAKWVINDGTYDIGDAAYDETITLTVTENLDILATYEGVSYAVTVKNGTANYTECVSGTVVTITADKAPEGYEFDSWTVDSQNASLADAYKATTTFTMPEGEVAVSASYKKIAYTVKVENGTSDKQSYYAGDTVTVTANYPASGREFNTWEAVSGNVSFADSSRWKTTFTMPATDVSLRATYKDGPSPNDNQILDLKEGAEYCIGDTIKFTASGAGMSNSNPNPGDYRYRPSAYQISNVSGVLQSPYSISMAIKEAGEYTVKATYNKDIFDGTNWVSDGTTDTKSVTFKVIPKSAAVQTGDETPIAMVVALAVVSCAVFVILLVIFLRRRKK